MRFIYTIGIFIYWIGIHIAAIFQDKAKAWVKGRKNERESLSEVSKQKSIWVHCASLGEFEQARPIIESLHSRYPDERIVLTFFSPSGYMVRNDYTLVQQVYYLPIDLPGKMRAFIDLVNPKIVVFVKYEFWFNCLHILRRNRIPYIFIAATFRPKQYFFSPILYWFRNLIKGADHIFVQDDSSLHLLHQKGFQNISNAGDPRIDRVITMSQEIKPIESLEKFSGGSKVFVCGSIHRSDYKHIKDALKEWNKNHKLILVPHDIDPKFIQQMQKDFKDNLLFTEIESKQDASKNCLIVDKVGLLSWIYPYADIVYIGGGFSKGIHNILEPAVFEKPVIIGPKYHTFPESKTLFENKGIHVIKTNQEVEDLLARFISSSTDFISMEAIHSFLEKNKGASKKIMHWLHLHGFIGS